MRKGKSCSPSAEPKSLISILQIVMVVVLLLHHQTCDATSSNKQTYCPPSSCGKITIIKHPFRLMDDPTTCGDPRYELSCENNITMLTLFSGKYYVKSIDYKNYTIRLVDPGIEEGDCSSIPRYYLNGNNFTYSYSISTDRYNEDPYQIDGRFGFQDIIYLNCSKPVKDDPEYLDTALCRVNLDSKSHVYAFVGGYFYVGKLKDYCRVKLVAMSSMLAFPNISVSVSVRDGVPDRQLSYQKIHEMLLYGFEISWISAACRDSCGDNEYCILSEITRGDFECHQSKYIDKCSYPFDPFGPERNCNHILTKLLIFVEGALKIVGTTKTYKVSKQELSISKTGLEIGKIIGRYLLPPCIVRYVTGLLVFCVLMIYICQRRHLSIYENIEVFLQTNTLIPIRYSYKEIKNMTRSFRDKLGEGGFGAVYKGKLRSGQLVAIKMLGKSKGNGQDFINEVGTIGRIHHTNVVRLIGFCFERSKRALVYEFMPNGSLDKYISSKENAISLTYNQMYEISLGVARGISYLHQGCDMQILHFDIKPHNILLDENFISKVSDFGLARLYPNDISIVTLTAARGTIGYMAPELFYQNIGGVSYKADVYSFGMLLMEMASKRRNLNPHADRSSQLFFPFWIYNQLVEEKDIEMDEISNEEMINVKKMFKTALWCIQLKPNDRPPMDRVIEMLEGNIENIEMPPKPSLYPNEVIQKDLEVTSNEIESDVAIDSVSFLEETSA
ncbi:LEAF RUST 10 DISEASE-RESISTANCE LOCUS RECEPTOR-LIKE PROTEIN KINASE-like 2.1 isoform X2 [Vicia villosa]|uniref:LEAF RUST 10 DISEASE-RESISTANCE LOCUS RECEPTOR-LIKE PROTEIN KINASE-like 2.1 isoform X2 n=1 Tax=Vicia villosa TaxID=3911 RepID=UPI00273AFC73|nr:LEAF RUST 10 DISEASE-RESISTANCE LOCUS RECEPTOR-LIKE PROTEIN KINASE-like 2.1 isoform X2 [Vicia villosa]